MMALMIFYAVYFFCALMSVAVFIYTSFGLGAANVLVLFGISYFVSNSTKPYPMGRAVLLFALGFIALSLIEISLGGKQGNGFGSGSPYIIYMVSGEYTEAGKFRAAKFVALGTFVFFVGELFRLFGNRRGKK